MRAFLDVFPRRPPVQEAARGLPKLLDVDDVAFLNPVVQDRRLNLASRGFQ